MKQDLIRNVVPCGILLRASKASDIGSGKALVTPHELMGQACAHFHNQQHAGSDDAAAAAEYPARTTIEAVVFACPRKWVLLLRVIGSANC